MGAAALVPSAGAEGGRRLAAAAAHPCGAAADAGAAGAQRCGCRGRGRGCRRRGDKAGLGPSGAAGGRVGEAEDRRRRLPMCGEQLRCHLIVQSAGLLDHPIHLGANLETLKRDDELQEVIVLNMSESIAIRLHEAAPGKSQSRQLAQKHEVRTRRLHKLQNSRGDLLEASVEETREVEAELREIVDVKPVTKSDDVPREVIAPRPCPREEGGKSPLRDLGAQGAQVGPALGLEPDIEEHGVQLRLMSLEERSHGEGQRGEIHNQRHIPDSECVQQQSLKALTALREEDLQGATVHLHDPSLGFECPLRHQRLRKFQEHRAAEVHLQAAPVQARQPTERAQRARRRRRWGRGRARRRRRRRGGCTGADEDAGGEVRRGMGLAKQEPAGGRLPLKRRWAALGGLPMERRPSRAVVGAFEVPSQGVPRLLVLRGDEPELVHLDSLRKLHDQRKLVSIHPLGVRNAVDRLFWPLALRV
mmetsp:Transcript_61836/g.201746  ORF Transcript_61836/g.201746 Transcript_61836/m.201746 type:complete len:475 (+) Transcript_61836:599-2023(+)